MGESPTGGMLVARALRDHGVSLVTCVPGESFLALLDALYDHRDAIRVVATRHEHGAAVMAEASAKLTGRPGVCMVTRGPGACNAAIGVHTARQDSTPMLLLVGQTPRPFLGRQAFQEVDLVHAFAPIAKHAEQVMSAAALPDAVARAFLLAQSGRPGPVVLVLPEDVLTETANAGPAAPRPAAEADPDPGAMERLHHMIGDAERPLVVVGGGGWSDEAKADLLAFVAASDLPVCCAFRRHDIVDNRHPAFVGELGLGADPALVARAREADLVLAVGTRLGEIPTQGYTLFETAGPEQALIHVHPEPDAIGRRRVPDLAIATTVGRFAAAARVLAPARNSRTGAWSEAARRDYEANRTPPAMADALNPGAVMAALDRLLPDDAIVTVDAGNFAGWPQRYLTFGGGRRLLGAANGAMGYGVPAAVAAKIAMPERMVVACVGDGGFGMTGQELATAAVAGAAVIVLLFDNGMFGTIRMHQERSYPHRVMATSLMNPDFAALAHAYGGHGDVVAETAAFAPAFQQAAAAGRLAVLRLVMDPERISTRATLSSLHDAARR